LHKISNPAPEVKRTRSKTMIGPKSGQVFEKNWKEA